MAKVNLIRMLYIDDCNASLPIINVLSSSYAIMMSTSLLSSVGNQLARFSQPVVGLAETFDDRLHI